VRLAARARGARVERTGELRGGAAVRRSRAVGVARRGTAGAAPARPRRSFARGCAGGARDLRRLACVRALAAASARDAGPALLGQLESAPPLPRADCDRGTRGARDGARVRRTHANAPVTRLRGRHRRSGRTRDRAHRGPGRDPRRAAALALARQRRRARRCAARRGGAGATTPPLRAVVPLVAALRGAATLAQHRLAAALVPLVWLADVAPAYAILHPQVPRD